MHSTLLVNVLIFAHAVLQSGNVKDIIILKDKVSGQPKGCAFVSYATEGEAERAIAELDRKIQLPGASSPMEVGEIAMSASMPIIA